MHFVVIRLLGTNEPLKAFGPFSSPAEAGHRLAVALNYSDASIFAIAVEQNPDLGDAEVEGRWDGVSPQDRP